MYFRPYLFLTLLSIYCVQVSAVSYSESIAKQAFAYQKISYCTSSVISYWTCGPDCENVPGISEVKVIEDTSWGTQAYTAYDNNNQRIILAIRGSHNIDNWIANLETIRVTYSKCSGCGVHDGIYKSYNSLRSGILTNIAELYNRYPSAEVWLQGHSLGASMIDLAAVDIKQQICNVDVLYTFEGPRTGNYEYAQFMNSLFPNAIRITHYDDVVPHLPYETLGFRHHGTEVYYDKPMESYVVCDGSGEDGKCADQWAMATGVSGHTTIFGVYSGCAVSYKQFVESKLKSLEN